MSQQQDGPQPAQDVGAAWDRRFAGPEHVYGEEPNRWLAAQLPLLPPPGSEALAVGDGEGRNGVWLAAQGLRVLSVDASAVGLAKARALAERRGLSLVTEQLRLEAWDWPVRRFALAASIFVHLPPATRPTVHAALAASLAPGGLLVLEAFLPAQLRHRTGGPSDPALLYTAELLRGDFAALDLLHLEETELELQEGHLHRGRSAVVRLLARRP
jgi:hypothetical protein